MTDAAETATTQETTTTETTETTQPETDWKAEAEKWKGLSQKNEKRAKENASAAKELDEFRQASMTEQEQAVAKAKLEGRSEALKESGARLVDAEFRVAAAGRTLDIDALLEGLDRTRFLTEDGEPNTEEIIAWVERIAPAQEEDEGPLDRSFDLGQGSSTNTPIGDNDAFEKVLKKAVGAR